MLQPLDICEVERAARLLFERNYSHLASWEKGCLLASVCVISVLEHIEPDVEHLLQAGSASFRIVPESLDDGVSDTHFSYCFNRVEAMPYLLQGHFPEMHCWVIRRHLNSDTELIDILFEHQLAQQEEMIPCVKWHESLRPRGHLWVNVNDLPLDVSYEADADAIGICLAFLRSLSRKEL